ncbi:hypothetical protein FHR24_000026 [Wenyingzhuangia heitensis]|uniref:DUF3078 domain-containing protein n=1 Tax=Wenyingzhuangia heitensis TaxID=1487859 RepID=A0ABX0U456_9FLAO|nr:DUF3078 domain-containing protein [Wenyingzhuangia heitensis]NIJ43587.1 hypothetical protein [Wenyingzhuangia heitensis]
MKQIIAIALLLCSTITIAQDKESNWKKGGVFTLLFNQSAFNNDWQGGGVSNIATSANVNYDFNYKKDNVVWDNKVILAYGLTKLDGNDDFNKTNDKIEISSLYGKQANKFWYYSAYANLKTQFAAGYKSSAQIDEISGFFSPAYLQAGPGMLWKKSDNLKVNITPASARAIFVSSKFTEDGSSFGVEQGETSRFELGANVAAYFKTDFVKNVTIENILNLYANYLEDAGNIDIDYTLNVAMKINDYLSANIAAQAIYDDNAVQAVQVREVFGLGFNYKF